MKKADGDIRFRVHFSDGHKLVVTARDSKAAHDLAAKQRPDAFVTKVKVERSGEAGKADRPSRPMARPAGAPAAAGGDAASEVQR